MPSSASGRELTHTLLIMHNQGRRFLVSNSEGREMKLSMRRLNAVQGIVAGTAVGAFAWVGIIGAVLVVLG